MSLLQNSQQDEMAYTVHEARMSVVGLIGTRKDVVVAPLGTVTISSPPKGEALS